MEGQNNIPGKPSPGPWRQAEVATELPIASRRTVLDAEGRQIFFAFGPNADANIALVLDTANAAHDVRRVFEDHLNTEECGKSEDFRQFVQNEVQAAVKRWYEMTPEKRESYREYNQFADDHSTVVLVAPDGPWAQSYQKHLRNLHDSDATPIPDAFLPQNQEP